MQPYRTVPVQQAIPASVRAMLLEDEEVSDIFAQRAGTGVRASLLWSTILLGALFVPLPGLPARGLLERLPSMASLLVLIALELWRRPKLVILTSRRVVFLRHWPNPPSVMLLEDIESVLPPTGRPFSTLRIETHASGRTIIWHVATRYSPPDAAVFCAKLNELIARRRALPAARPGR